ncbi:MAG: hypothetical protein ACFFGP_04155 [Promethearchaeota archaeon]
MVNPQLSKIYCLSSENVIETAVKYSNKAKQEFSCSKFVILLFSNSLLDYLKKKINMVSTKWLSPYHPYASNQLHKGVYKGIPISAIMPPMGASPIASVAEDLISCGAEVLLLVCGAWGIAQNVKLLDFLIPTHAIGPDGTSIYYGRNPNDISIIDKEIVNIFSNEIEKRTMDYHIGKNYSIEAFYRIDIEQVKNLQSNGFVSIENGEVNALTTVATMKQVRFGAIFYSYYNPLAGWNVPWFQEDYKKCVELEGEITLATIKSLANKL